MATDPDDELEYLTPGFDPANLKVPELRSILVAHAITYPASSKKGQLIEIFNQQLVPRARKILAARAKIKRSSAGITNMPSSQEPLVDGDDDELPPLRQADPGRPRRSRSTRASTDDTLAESAASKASGRRRTTRTPSAAVDTEASTESQSVRPSARKSRRSQAPEPKMETEEATSRATADDESPFSNSNPFQSGSSPLAQTESRRRSAARKSNGKSASRRTTEQPRKIKQEPDEDAGLQYSTNTYEVPVKSLARTSVKTEDVEEQGDPLEAGEEFTIEEQQAMIQEGVTRGEADIIHSRRKKSKKSASTLKKAPVAILAALMAGYGTWWRQEKIEVGYCGVGKEATTLQDLQIPKQLYFLQPTCEVCPNHAVCSSNMEVQCDKDYVSRSNPLSLGGFLPFVPKCEPDGEKARKVKAVATKTVEVLRERNAKFECGELNDESGKRAKAAKISEPSLKAEVSSKKATSITDEQFALLFKEAIGDVEELEEVTSETDENNVLFLSSSSLARIPFDCAIKRSVRIALGKFFFHIGAVLGLIALAAYVRAYIKNWSSDKARIPSLVSMTLDRVATQAALHAQGAIPEAFVSVGQMRDDVLRDEFSPQRRDRLWKKVQAIVENNANIRSNVREGRNGEVSRVWEWIGSVETLEDSWVPERSRRSGGRVSFGPLAGTPGRGDSDSRAGTPRLEGGERKWDEGRPIY